MTNSSLLHSLLLLCLHYYQPGDAFSIGGISSSSPSPLKSKSTSASRHQTAIMSQSDASDTATASFTTIDGISSLALLEKYDTFLLDMWGVMHNGSEPYEGVLQTIQELKNAGKKMIILSNSSKRREKSDKMLTKLGFNPSDFHNIITSGDVSHSLLQNSAETLGCSNWDMLTNLINQNKRNVFVFGSGDDDEQYVTSAGWTLSTIEHADLIVSRGTFTINDGTTIISKNENEAEYWKVMEEAMTIASQRKVPMLVTNPDKVRPDEGLPPMPGAIGDTYERFVWTSHCHPVGDMTEEKARGYVKRVGKPFREVYDIALDGGDSSRAIMIGDALETDVVGGHAAGVDVLWVVKDGIHGEDINTMGGPEGVLQSFNANEFTYAYGKKVVPRYQTNHFRW
eukprot:CAMPEP_0183716458 /NCGR_PEP_ID=MMETSP0737-20130205/10373_1 /TAXON_ID=385413 /ORGANISM="Thalassiosira miniscula, Strain CCMP1093" /LENGTH=396 /DNA_ID=CAMNT_0025945735 /DNA_START=71 /DNA_END=1261 /DNA_ORIENTATION=+